MAGIRPGLKDDSFPKVTDHRQVMIEIEFCDVREDDTDLIVR